MLTMLQVVLLPLLYFVWLSRHDVPSFQRFFSIKIILFLLLLKFYNLVVQFFIVTLKLTVFVFPDLQVEAPLKFILSLARCGTDSRSVSQKGYGKSQQVIFLTSRLFILSL